MCTVRLPLSRIHCHHTATHSNKQPPLMPIMLYGSLTDFRCLCLWSTSVVKLGATPTAAAVHLQTCLHQLGSSRIEVALLTQTHTHLHTYTHTHTHKHMHMHACTNSHTNICTCMHAQTHTQMHKHVHTHQI